MPPHLLSPLRGPSLCLDVFVMVFDVLSRQSEVVALASTCKIMNTLGARRLLALGVEIDDDDDLVSFCRFMLADLDRRGPQLRKLSISIETDINIDRDEWDRSGMDSNGQWMTDVVDPDMASDLEMEIDSDSDSESEGEEEETECSGPYLLARVLRGATRLEDLDIGCAEELMQRGGEDLRRALVTLPALRRLRTATLGLGTLAVVRGMTAPLVEIDLSFDYFNMTMMADMFDVLRLPAFQATLEKVTLWSADLGGQHFVWHELADDLKPRFPRVHTLAVRAFDHGLYLPALVHAFPNLQTLDLTDVWQPNGDIDVCAEHARNRTVPMDNSWISLKNLCGDVDALYALALMRHVPRVDVDNVRLKHDCLGALRAVIGGTSPSRLLLHINQPEEALSFAEAVTALSLLFPSPAAAGITHLALDFNSTPGVAVWCMLRDLDRARYCFLWPLTSLRHLIIRIGDDKLFKSRDESPQPRPFTTGTWKQQFMLSYASLILGGFPQLLSVTFDLAVEGLGPRGASHSFWKQRFPTGTMIMSQTWWARGFETGVAPPWIAAKGMQWHRRLEFAELPLGY